MVRRDGVSSIRTAFNLCELLHALLCGYIGMVSIYCGSERAHWRILLDMSI